MDTSLTDTSPSPRTHLPMDTSPTDMDMDSSNAVVHPGTLSLSPSIDPLVLIISDAIKQAMESSTTAQQQSIAAMAEKNSMDTLVAQISETLASHGGHIFLHPPHSCPPSPSAHTILVAEKMICMPPSTGTYHSGCLQEHSLMLCWCCRDKKLEGCTYLFITY